MFFVVPASVSNGEYLIRIEHLALHSAHLGEYQVYTGCGQVKVGGGHNGIPGPLVAFPGAYKDSDPGIRVNIWGGIVSFAL